MTKEKAINLSRSELLKHINNHPAVSMPITVDMIGLRSELEIPKGLNKSQMKKIMKGEKE